MAEIHRHSEGRASLLAFCVGLLFGDVGAGVAEAEAVQHTLSNLSVIHLSAGANHIEHFAADGRPAIITLGWRDNGNAHGYDLFLVLMPASDKSDWNVVGLQTDDAFDAEAELFADTVNDAPHMGDDFVRAIRFVRGKLDGRPATLLLTATRDFGDPGISSPSLVTYGIYELVPRKDPVGTTADFFQQIQTYRSLMKFCNAELALSKRFDIPLRTEYEGPNTIDGCS